MVNPTSSAGGAGDTPDRRRHHHVRAIFDEAYRLIEPFFAPGNRWANVTLDHLAYRVLRDHHPELDVEEVHLIVAAARRVSAERGEATAPE